MNSFLNFLMLAMFRSVDVKKPVNQIENYESNRIIKSEPLVHQQHLRIIIFTTITFEILPLVFQWVPSPGFCGRNSCSTQMWPNSSWPAWHMRSLSLWSACTFLGHPFSFKLIWLIFFDSWQICFQHRFGGFRCFTTFI